MVVTWHVTLQPLRRRLQIVGGCWGYSANPPSRRWPGSFSKPSTCWSLHPLQKFKIGALSHVERNLPRGHQAIRVQAARASNFPASWNVTNSARRRNVKNVFGSLACSPEKKHPIRSWICVGHLLKHAIYFANLIFASNWFRWQLFCTLQPRHQLLLADSEPLIGSINDGPVQNATVGHRDTCALVAIDSGVEPTYLAMRRYEKYHILAYIYMAKIRLCVIYVAKTVPPHNWMLTFSAEALQRQHPAVSRLAAQPPSLRKW